MPPYAITWHRLERTRMHTHGASSRMVGKAWQRLSMFSNTAQTLDSSDANDTIPPQEHRGDKDPRIIPHAGIV